MSAYETYMKKLNLVDKINDEAGEELLTTNNLDNLTIKSLKQLLKDIRDIEN